MKHKIALLISLGVVSAARAGVVNTHRGYIHYDPQPAVLEVAALGPIPSCAVPLCRIVPCLHACTVPYSPVAFHGIAANIAASASLMYLRSSQAHCCDTIRELRTTRATTTSLWPVPPTTQYIEQRIQIAVRWLCSLVEPEEAERAGGIGPDVLYCGGS